MGAKCDNQGPGDPWSEFPECVATCRAQARVRRTTQKSREAGRFRSKKYYFSTYRVPSTCVPHILSSLILRPTHPLIQIFVEHQLCARC